MNFNLPQGWKLAKLGEVGEVITGSTPSTSKPEYYGSEVPFVTPVDLDNDDPVTKAQNYLSRSGASQARLLPPDAVMVCCIGSLGKVGIAGIQLATNQQINSLIFDKSKILPRYGYHFCKTLKPILEHMAPSTTVAIVNKSRFSEITIPFPPLPEQRRLAAILDKADAIRRKRQRAIVLTEDFLRSAFLEMFGDPVTNPKGWGAGTIDEVVSNPKEDIRCGPFGTQLKVRELVPEGIPLLGIENVHNDHFVSNTEKFLTEKKAEELSRFDACPGDVLITRMGSIGRACVVPKGIGKARISYHLFRIRTNPDKCLPEFLAATICRSGTFQHQLRRLAHGAIMDGLSTSILKEIVFLLPPVEMQLHYLNVVRKVERNLIKINHSAENANILFSSLTHRAFRGELTPQAAEKLLKEAAAG
ncbi:restriction modification system DNA specificity domain protein (plasmid) [Nitrosococcus halophilus Nc 4]|uniref:Restriction modification system DNA specificity domain protein n=1 Tax=Nitrosococcus halophilus (strain Nc4) TaxID=472759 RepID=D5C5B9_NITHN|nr:restriction endonuclease subunit S [Nitrosococcus halophilus]ADE16973.1 restriction modification system DNA specificity domain protein [Nitrosococcus halophilus Nc 4]